MIWGTRDTHIRAQVDWTTDCRLLQQRKVRT